MSKSAIFVDLPNFYSRLLDSKIETPRVLRDYFLEWLDLDRIAEKLTGEHSDVWVFYSGRRFGPSSNRIQDQFLDEYINRLNSLKGVTARDVNIPGQQREPITMECEECGHENQVQWESEKGIDSSLTVLLLDTNEYWDKAYLLSGDADFVPAVASLRRRGKIVIGAGFSDASTALIRECYDYIDLSQIFLKDDVAAYQVFNKNGIVGNWLLADVLPEPGNNDFTNRVELTFEWQMFSGSIATSYSSFFTIEDAITSENLYQVYLIAKGNIDLSTRLDIINKFQQSFPIHVRYINNAPQKIGILISPLAWKGVGRRLEDITSNFIDAQMYNARGHGYGYTLGYVFDENSQTYLLDSALTKKPS